MGRDFRRLEMVWSEGTTRGLEPPILGWEGGPRAKEEDMWGGECFTGVCFDEI